MSFGLKRVGLGMVLGVDAASGEVCLGLGYGVDHVVAKRLALAVLRRAEPCRQLLGVSDCKTSRNISVPWRRVPGVLQSVFLAPGTP